MIDLETLKPSSPVIASEFTFRDSIAVVAERIQPATLPTRA